jgi:hypothetical protein
MLLTLGVTFALGIMIRDCGFFPGLGAQGGSTTTSSSSSSSAASASSEPEVASSTAQVGLGNELVLVLRNQRVWRGERALPWNEVEQTIEAISGSNTPIKLVIDAGSITLGDVERARALLRSKQLRWSEEEHR